MEAAGTSVVLLYSVLQDLLTPSSDVHLGSVRNESLANHQSYSSSSLVSLSVRLLCGKLSDTYASHDSCDMADTEEFVRRELVVRTLACGASVMLHIAGKTFVLVSAIVALCIAGKAGLNAVCTTGRMDAKEEGRNSLNIVIGSERSGYTILILSCLLRE